MIRTSLPSRIPLGGAFAFSVLIFFSLIAEGNNPTTALAVFAWIVATTYGFNRVKGLTSPVGAYLMFVVLFSGLLGVFVKILLDEPLQRNVQNADESLWIYLTGTVTTVIAAIWSEKVALKKPILSGRLNDNNVDQAVAGGMIVGIGLPLMLWTLTPSLGSIARQLNVIVPFAILIGVYQRVRSTDGRSSFAWPTFLAWIYSTQLGVFSYSKEGMFAPSLAWIVAALAGKIRISILQALCVIAAGAFAVSVLVPYSQYGRQFRVETASNPQLALKLLRHPLDIRDRYERDIAASPAAIGYHWFDQPQGIFDRLTMLPIDSVLIQKTDLTGPIGIDNTFKYLENIIPHFILPGKPEVKPGNDYAHELGMLASDDSTTGISFSPFADAYHQGGWLGVIFLQPGILFLLFVSLRSVVGGISDGPWGLFFTAAFAHLAAEGLLVLPVYILSVGMEAALATAFVMLYVTPVIGSLILGPGKRRAMNSAPPGLLGLRSSRSV